MRRFPNGLEAALAVIVPGVLVSLVIAFHHDDMRKAEAQPSPTPALGYTHIRFVTNTEPATTPFLELRADDHLLVYGKKVGRFPGLARDMLKSMAWGNCGGAW